MKIKIERPTTNQSATIRFRGDHPDDSAIRQRFTVDTDGCRTEISDCYDGVGIRTERGLFSIAEHGGALEIQFDGRPIWSSEEGDLQEPIHEGYGWRESDSMHTHGPFKTDQAALANAQAMAVQDTILLVSTQNGGRVWQEHEVVRLTKEADEGDDEEDKASEDTPHND